MAKLVWDKTGDRLYETGVKQGILFPVVGGQYSKGVVWNGLSSITESPSGAEATDIYADDTKYLTMRSAETFGGTIEAYTYPDEFEACDGSAEIADGVTVGQQARSAFGLCYRTTLGNDSEGESHGYKLHIIYGATASPSEKNYQTINDSPEAISFSWSISTTPINVTGHKPTSLVVLDSTKVGSTKMALIEAALYGNDDGDSYLPTPDQIIKILDGSVQPQPKPVG